MLTGLNHITISVSCLDTSLHFYTQILGFKAHVKCDAGAYLSLGDLWLCLSLNTSPSPDALNVKTPPEKKRPTGDYSHIAFSVSAEDFASVKQKIIKGNATIWKDNKSEGKSLYFLDPDSHKLEIHNGNLQQRLDSLKTQPYAGLKWLC